MVLQGKSLTSSTTSARFCSSLSAWWDCRPPDLDNLIFNNFILNRKLILFHLIFMSGHPSSLAITRCSEDITVIENLNENKGINQQLQIMWGKIWINEGEILVATWTHLPLSRSMWRRNSVVAILSLHYIESTI